MMTPPPPEWAPHDAVWIGFPSDPELWLEDLAPAQAEVARFVQAVHADGRGERVVLVAADAEAARAAQALVGDAAEIVTEPFGDIWLRDTATIIGGDRAAHAFGFNGWGGKYELDGDDDIATEHHLETTPCRMTVDAGDDGNIECPPQRDSAKTVGPRHRPIFQAGGAAAALHVGAGTERAFAATGQHHGADVAIVLDRLPDLFKFALG